MDLKWLEDFISLAETHSFSRSAELRHVTQPAFSRRIRSLESWLGVDLIDRTAYPTRLTPAGELFHGQALEILAQLSHARALLRGQQSVPPDTVNVAVPHTLALTFFPKWLTEVKRTCGEFSTRLTAGNVHDAVMALESGGCDLLLCYHHPHQPVHLDPARYDMLVLGEEILRPYARCDSRGVPMYCLPGQASAPVPFLAYAPGAYLERMVALMVAEGEQTLHLAACYETDMAEGLKSMVLEGHGLAFLPESAVSREVRRHQLAVAGDARWQLSMEIRLYREHRSSKPLVNTLWQTLSDARHSKRGRGR